MVSTPKLFAPLTLGAKNDPIQLQHRVVMAPLTRLRTGESGVPTDLAATYYGQRATNGGLIISEATNISATARGYFGSPGLFNTSQIEAWKAVTEAVHAKGGKIFCQLWHTGRVGHPLNQPDNILPVSSTAEPINETQRLAITREGRQPYVTPRALEIHEILEVVQDYRKAAENAITAGFDGVELHCANGYLLEQFLCDGVNKRKDQYGGSVENRSKFLFQALEAILESVDSSKVGIRLSPFGVTFACTDSDPATTYSYVVEKLNDYDLAYLHVIEPRMRHTTNPLTPKEGVTAFLRPKYHGVLMTASAYDREEAMRVVEKGIADCVAFGVDFISNPDLVQRLRLDAPLNSYDASTFYFGSEKGYTDYPFLEQKQ